MLALHMLYRIAQSSKAHRAKSMALFTVLSFVLYLFGHSSGQSNDNVM